MTTLLEPAHVATLMAAAGALAVLSALLTRTSHRVGLPVALLFLGLGMLAGSDGIGHYAFDNYRLALQIGVAALVLILFDGGLNTPAATLRAGLAPATLLATFGVILTAGLLAFFALLLGLPTHDALLLGAIVSSTDAASVFAILRGGGLRLRRRLGVTLELESGLNDPMAVILTLGFTQAALAHTLPSANLLLEALLQLGVGALVGLLFGWLSRCVLQHIELPATGLYPVLTSGIAFLIFGIATLARGSGFMAVYLAAILLGNTRLPYKSGLLRVHDGIAWMCQVALFLMLGLLVTPSHLVDVAPLGLTLALLLAFVARPLAVWLCILPFSFDWRESLYLCWIGLRGAVPIVLAMFPVLAQVPGARKIFDIVFFIVTISALVPGGTVRWATRRLKLQGDAPPAPPAVLEIASTRLLQDEVLTFFIAPASAAAGSCIAQIPFPKGCSALLIVRGEKLIAPKGATVVEPGDYVYVFCPPKTRAELALFFGSVSSEE